MFYYYDVAITTDGSGDFTGYTTKAQGWLIGFKLTSVDLTGAGTISVQNENYARENRTEFDGTVTDWASGDFRLVKCRVEEDSLSEWGTAESQLPILGDRLQVVVAGGGATKTGTLRIIAHLPSSKYIAAGWTEMW